MLRAAIAQRGGLPLNVKFLIEGEEEIGSPHLPGYVREHARELACDLVISADGAQWRPDEPSLSVASKGLVAFTITVEGRRATTCTPAATAAPSPTPRRCLRRSWQACTTPTARSPSPGSTTGSPRRARAARAARRGAVRRRAVRRATRGHRDLRRGRVLHPAAPVGAPDPGGQRGDRRRPLHVIPHVAAGSSRAAWSVTRTRSACSRRSAATWRASDVAGVRVTVEQDGGAVPAYSSTRRTRPSPPPPKPCARSTRARRCCRPSSPARCPPPPCSSRSSGRRRCSSRFSTADEKLHAPNEFLRLRRIHEGMRAWDALLISMADGPHRLQPVTLPDLAEATCMTERLRLVRLPRRPAGRVRAVPARHGSRPGARLRRRL